MEPILTVENEIEKQGLEWCKQNNIELNQYFGTYLVNQKELADVIGSKFKFHKQGVYMTLDEASLIIEGYIRGRLSKE